jgi:hypothetical protein
MNVEVKSNLQTPGGTSSAHRDKAISSECRGAGGATICGQKAGDACSRLMRYGVFSDNIALSGASKRGVP